MVRRSSTRRRPSPNLSTSNTRIVRCTVPRSWVAANAALESFLCTFRLRQVSTKTVDSGMLTNCLSRRIRSRPDSFEPRWWPAPPLNGTGHRPRSGSAWSDDDLQGLVGGGVAEHVVGLVDLAECEAVGG